MPKAKPAKSKVTEKKVQKVVEDKTFGLKNKNKSKKVQQYVERVQNQARNSGGAQSRAFHEKNAAAKKAEKEARKQAELEMFKLLGDAYKPKIKKKKKKTAEESDQTEKPTVPDVPLTLLKDTLLVINRTEIERIVVHLDWKDNLASDETNMYIKISDGSTKSGQNLLIFNMTPTKFDKKVENILDIRNIVAIRRNNKVHLETTEKTVLTLASDQDAENTRERKEAQVDNDHIPLEQVIEEQRQLLKSHTPVSKDLFEKWKKDKEASNIQKALDTNKKLSGRELFLTNQSVFLDSESLLEEDFSDLDLDDEEDLN